MRYIFLSLHLWSFHLFSLPILTVSLPFKCVLLALIFENSEHCGEDIIYCISDKNKMLAPWTFFSPFFHLCSYASSSFLVSLSSFFLSFNSKTKGLAWTFFWSLDSKDHWLAATVHDSFGLHALCLRYTVSVPTYIQSSSVKIERKRNLLRTNKLP